VAVLDGKDDPLDPVLWKSAKASEPDEVKWASEFGAGRPGWHIECSAMACELLGETLDIHGGGEDLQFPHHENEIAQSEGATGKPLSNYWMHNGFIVTDNEKMSKSLGNFFLIRDVLKKYDAETIRFFVLRAHYRRPLNYSDVHLDDARSLAQAAVHGARPRDARRRQARLGRSLCRALQGRDGRRLRHARSGGRALRLGGRSEPHEIARTGRPAEGAGCVRADPAGRPEGLLARRGPRSTKPPSRPESMRVPLPRPRRISPRPTAFARNSSDRASCSRIAHGHDLGGRAVNGTTNPMPATKKSSVQIYTPDYWEEACKHLSRKDRVMKRLIPKFGDACLESRGDAFTTLARSVVGQQISVKAAQSVWDKFAALPRKLTPASVLKLKVDDMRAAGLSARKIEYLVDLALHFDSGMVHVDSWKDMSDELIIEELVAIRGIGRWTAEMFLIFT
jgi:DNA-3-methyladenine glycosylase II